MASWDEVRRLATALPDVTEHNVRGLRQWKYPIVLVQLDRISRPDLREVVTEAWLVRK